MRKLDQVDCDLYHKPFDYLIALLIDLNVLKGEEWEDVDWASTVHRLIDL